MWIGIKRLFLGILLLALSSGVLLLSDLRRRSPSTGRIRRIAILQLASQAVIDEGVQGMLDGLADGGFREGQNLTIERFNAHNDIPTATAIARQVTEVGFDLVLTATTIMMQAMANANQAGKTVHVFGLVSDPWASGVGLRREQPLAHPKHMVGLGTMQPVAATFRLAQKMFPALKRVGVAWNPAETNSEITTREARKVSQELGIELLEATVENSSGVAEASSSLISRGAQALWVGGDVTVNVALDSLVATARKAGIPVFTCIPGGTAHGTLFDLGANYHEVGRLTGALAAKILAGSDPATIPVQNLMPERLELNKTALAGLKEGWRIPADVLGKADSIRDDSGVEEKALPRGALGTPGSGAPLLKKWHVFVIEYNDVLDVKETEDGIRQGLPEAGLVEGRDFDLEVLNAQGDMATVSALIDSAVTRGADMLMTLSTPTLQAAIRRARDTPIVFSYVANGIVAGAGRSETDHLHNVTGVSLIAPYDEMMTLLRRYYPSVRTVGTLFVPSESNMVFQREQMLLAAKKVGIDVVVLPVSTATEVPDAALALTSQKIDAVCQMPGNLTAAAFGSIRQAALRARLPVFAFQKSQAVGGAVVVFGRDYFDSGKEAARMAASVMRGRSPATIPFENFSKTELILNREAAREIGFPIPPGLLRQAKKFIGDERGNP